MQNLGSWCKVKGWERPLTPARLSYEPSFDVLQNDHDELWNIMDFAVPGSLGEKNQFKDYYAVPMKKAQQASASSAAIEKAGLGLCQIPPEVNQGDAPKEILCMFPNLPFFELLRWSSAALSWFNFGIAWR